MAKPTESKATTPDQPSAADSGNGKDQTKPIKTMITPTTTTTTNGSSNGNDNGTQPPSSLPSSSSSSSSSSLSMTMIVFRVLVAICSLALGLLSPLLLEIYREQCEMYSVVLVEEAGSSSSSQATTKPRKRSSSGFGKIFVAADDSCQADQGGGGGAAAATESVDMDERQLNVVEEDEDEDDSSTLVQYQSARYACDKEVLSNYLHHEEVYGMHVVCVQQQQDGLGGRLMLFPNAMHLKDDDLWEIRSDTDPLTWGWIKEQLVNELELPPTDALHQPWAIFSPTGEERLRDELDPDNASIEGVLDYGLFLVFQGGQWIWPGVAKGYKRTIQLEWVATTATTPPNDDESKDKATTTTAVTTRTTTAILETLSLVPLVLSVEGFLSEDECDLIQTLAQPHLEYSSVTLMDHDKGRPASDFRTSQSAFLRPSVDPVANGHLESIDFRTASLVRMPRTHQEYAQVLRYGHKEKYDTHHDYFTASLYKNDPGTLKSIQNGRLNRMATVFWYLTTVEKGGETVFPRADKGPYPPNNMSCDRGLLVKPIRGRVIIFYSMTPDGSLDEYSLHGACPVEEGVKWAANKWVWNAPKTYYRS